MATRLFLRNASSTVSGTLPTAEQSTLAVDDYFDTTNTDTLNKKLSRLKGTTETCLQNTSIGASTQKNYYVHRWVSEPLTQTSIAANTWTYNFGAKDDVANASFPTASASDTTTVYVNCYIWKPSNGTKVGTIRDGLLAASLGQHNSGTPVTNLVVYQGTFAGSAVSGLTSGDAVIVFEAWFRVTQTDTSTHTQAFGYDGPTVWASGSTNKTDVASYIQTPENISFNDGLIETKLYFHATTSGLPAGTLPSAEQSSKTVTSGCQFEGSDSTNRLMNTSIGTSQASLALTTPANTSANTYYVTRFVSPLLYQTSIAAGDWYYNFSAKEDNASANFPVSGNNQVVAICCYAWKPSNGTKYANIKDGNSEGSTYSEGAANTQVSEEGTFTGAAVSSLVSGDTIIVFEVWFLITQASNFARTATFYYDGTTETRATGTTVSNHASFVSYFGDGSGLNFVKKVDIVESSVSISDALSRLKLAVRSLADSITISDALDKVALKKRSLADTITFSDAISVSIVGGGPVQIDITDSVSFSDNISKVAMKYRSLNEASISISDAISRFKKAIRSLPDSVTVSDNLAKVATKKRSLADTITSSDTLARFKKAFRTLADTITSSDNLVKQRTAPKAISDSVSGFSDSLTRFKKAFRTLSDSVTVSDNLTKVATKKRSLADTITFNDTLSRFKKAIRSLPETITISDAISRFKKAIRNLADTVTLSDILDESTGNQVNISDSIGFTDNVTRTKKAFRSLADSVTFSDNVTKVAKKIRNISDTLSLSDVLNAIKLGGINLFESIGVTDTLTKIALKKRLIADSVVLSDVVNGVKGAGITLLDSIGFTDNIARTKLAFRTLSESITIADQIAVTKKVFRQLLEIINFDDNIDKTLIKTANLIDSITTSDTITIFKKVIRNLVEVIPIQDIITIWSSRRGVDEILKMHPHEVVFDYIRDSWLDNIESDWYLLPMKDKIAFQNFDVNPIGDFGVWVENVSSRVNRFMTDNQYAFYEDIVGIKVAIVYYPEMDHIKLKWHIRSFIEYLVETADLESEGILNLKVVSVKEDEGSVNSNTYQAQNISYLTVFALAQYTLLKLRL